MKIMIGNTIYLWLDDFVVRTQEDVPKAWRLLADEVHKEAIVFEDGIILGVEQ